MTLLRWLLSHLVLLIVIGALALAWLRWEDLEGWVPDPVNRVVLDLRARTRALLAGHAVDQHDVKAGEAEDGTPVLSARPEALVPAPVSEEDAVGESEAPAKEPAMTGMMDAGEARADKTDNAVDTSKAEPAAEPVADTQAGGVPAEGGAEAPLGGEPVQEAGVAGAAPEADGGVVFPPLDETRALAASTQPAIAGGTGNQATETSSLKAVPEAGTSVPAPAGSDEEGNEGTARSTGGEAFDDLLARARGAFWQRRLGESVAAYRKLARLAPDNPDVWGELGNVLFAAGDMRAAAEAWSRAADGLLDRGRVHEVRPLLPFIHRIDPARAWALHRRMQAAAASVKSR